MKTAISLSDHLFKEADHLAEEEHLSRSELFARAVSEYIERRRHRDLLQKINEAYADSTTSEEQDLRKRSRRYYAAKIVEKGRR